MEIPATGIVAAIKVLRERNSVFGSRTGEGIKDFPTDARLVDMPFAAGAVKFRFACEMVLHFSETGQYVAPAPACQTQLAPLIVIGGLPAHIDHRIDRR